jgi:hypothetical protein
LLHLLAGVGFKDFLMQHLSFLGSAVGVYILWVMIDV